MKRLLKVIMNLSLKVIMNLSVFLFFSLLFLGLIRNMVYWYPEIPVIFSIGWIIGGLTLLIFSLYKDWCPYIILERKKQKTRRKGNG